MAGLSILMVSLLFSSSLVIYQASAQTAFSPQFLVTWKTAGSYIPSFYQGKALPTYGSKITASVELVWQGKILNITNQTIYWYLNDNLVGGGVGVQQVSFPPTGDAPNSLTLKVVLPSYNGGYYSHAIQIPMVKPVAVIYAPFPGGQFSQNPITVKAYPYFFNTAAASDLAFTWTVNGQVGANAENPEQAQITLPAGTPAGAPS